jgi:uncharacterized RDD family membrane protein YckC
MEQQSYLSDIEFNPVLASPGQRFLNYLIDITIFCILFIFLVLGFFIGIGKDYNSSGPPTYELIERLIFLLIVAAFYFLSELIFNGRTIGKFITGTKAVNRDGTELQPETILLRSLSRLVPFEAFSALGNPSRPWHDTWTRTLVIDVSKTKLNSPSF